MIVKLVDIEVTYLLKVTSECVAEYFSVCDI